MTDTTPKSMDDIVALCRRRGFIWQSSEIYGGINGFWDYGPLGVELKRNLKEAWWRDIVRCPPDGPDGQPIDMVSVDCTIIMNPKVWEASGHVDGFNDPMVDDKETNQRFRADHLIGIWIGGDKVDLFDDAEQQVHAHLLAATIVASGVDEAIQLLSSNPKAATFNPSAGIKLEGIEEVTPDERDTRGRTLLKLVTKDGSWRWGILGPVTVEMLNRAPSDVPSPFSGKRDALTSPRAFNLMFPTYVGATATEHDKAYLRPETAQGIFTQFWNVVDTSRVKVPFGIAQQGKTFRNEVTPRNFTFRSREFEQMEIEFFIHPSEADAWYAYWRDSRYAWWQSVGLAGDNLTLREHDPDELAHYAKGGAGTSDIEYRFPFTSPGYGELEGVAHRTDFDLRQHAEHTGMGDKMRYFDQANNDRYFPHVIEPSAGADRGTLALLCEAFTPTPDRKGSKFVMAFEPRMAPIKAGIFPLVNKDGMPEVAQKLYKDLRETWAVQLDAKQSIGKRYARMDEAGTPFCFTIDGETLTDQSVTVRHRDTLEQERIGIDKVAAFLIEHIGA